MDRAPVFGVRNNDVNRRSRVRIPDGPPCKHLSNTCQKTHVPPIRCREHIQMTQDRERSKKSEKSSEHVGPADFKRRRKRLQTTIWSSINLYAIWKEFQSTNAEEATGLNRYRGFFVPVLYALRQAFIV